MNPQPIKRIPPAEFVELGFLQEVNRQFFHPRGMALEVVTDETGTPTAFGGVWDYRDDPEGIYYGGSRPEAAKAQESERLFIEKAATRAKLLGSPVEPLVTP